MTYEELLKAHLSDTRIVSMPDGTKVKRMSESLYKINVTTDIKGDYEGAYLALYVSNEDGVESKVKESTN